MHDTTDLHQIRDAERRNRQLAAFHAVAQTGAEADLERLVPHLARVAADATESDCAVIYLGDPARGEPMVLRGIHGYQGPLVERYSRIEPDSEVGHMVRSFSPRAFSVQNLHTERGLGTLQAGFVEAAVVPLHTKGRASGVVLLLRRHARAYDSEETFAAHILADLIAIQIEKARLHDESERRVRHLSLLFELARAAGEASAVEPLVERIVQAALEALSVDSAMVHLLADGRLALAGFKSRDAPPPEQVKTLHDLPMSEATISGRAALRRATVTVDFAHWPAHTANVARARGGRHAAAAPLLTGDVLVGTFCVVRQTETPFTPDEIRLLESCGAHIARAVEHARLFEAERRRAHDLTLINELGRLISEQLDLSHVLRAGVGQLARITDIPEAYLLLYDAERDQLRVVATNTEHHDALEIVVSSHQPAAALTAIRERRPVLIPDTAARDAGPHAVPLATRYNHRALLAVPLVARGAPLGAVLLGETREGRTLTPAVVERATAVANQLATALSNARLFEDLRQSYAELERAQKQLVQRERLAALGELAASVAHEIRNPLAVIFNSVAALRRRVPEGPDVRMLLDIVGEEAGRLNRIVGELLDFARPAEPKLARGPIELVISSAAEAATAAMADAARGLSVEVVPGLTAVEMDAEMVRQALINLMVNALQATPPGGMVRVRATPEQASGRAWVRVDVSDDGPGIPATLSGQVFQPFFTTKAKGTGLGLAIVRRIVEAHHGEVCFESGEGRGATFTLRLPA